MSCGQACDGCNERAQHHLCPACANEDIDNLKKQLREAQAEVERLRDVVRHVHAMTGRDVNWAAFPGVAATALREIHKITKEKP